MINMEVAGAYPDFVNRITEKLTDAGFEAYIVGGCLRDTLSGRPPKDYDVATSALPAEIIGLFNTEGGFKTAETGIKYGTVTVICQGNPVEVTTFRVDGNYADRRRPENVIFTGKITEDLSRRDFTVNAMAYSPLTGLIDPFCGKKDLENGLIRAVGTPEKRFGEDAEVLKPSFASHLSLMSTVNLTAFAYLGEEKIARERISGISNCDQAPSTKPSG